LCLTRTILLLLVSTGVCLGQQVDGFLELSGSRRELSSVSPLGPAPDRLSRTLGQRYNIDGRWLLSPRLTVRAGGLFDIDDSSLETSGVTTDRRSERLRPYANILYGTPLFSVDLGFYLLKESNESGGQSSDRTRESYVATAIWEPEGLPEWMLRLSRDNSFDDTRQRQDFTEDFAELSSRYSPIDSLRLEYRSSLRDGTDRLRGNETRTTTHFGRVSFGDSFFDRRVRLSTHYNVTSTDIEFRSAGAGEVLQPVFSVSGLFAVTDFPEDVVLAPSELLIDGDLLSSAGIDLGLPSPGEEDGPRNVGLDFGAPEPVDTLRVWVDRELTEEVADFFSWDVYTSEDNVTWQLRARGALSEFGVFENRFELRFSQLETQYIKIVVRPLDLSVPDAAQFPDIFVTELEAFDRRSAGSSFDRPRETFSQFLAAVRTQLIEGRSFYHDLSYVSRSSSGDPTVYTLSNGLTYSERLNRVYTMSARATREDGRQPQGDQTTHTYSASLRAAPIPTLSHNVVFTTRDTERRGLTSEQSSVFLYTTAALYRGVNATLSMGQLRSRGEDGRRNEGERIRLTTTLAPHRSLSLNLLYRWQKDENRGGQVPGPGSRKLLERRVSATFTPVSSVYSFFSYRILSERGQRDRIFRSFSVGWSPFRGGALQLSLSYDESFRSEFESRFRVYSASARWNASNRFFVELSYSNNRVDSTMSERDTRGLTALTRLRF
jgi:hypothetical protein